MSADQAQDEAAEEAPLLPPAPAPPAAGQDEEPSDWRGQVFGQAPLHHLGNFLDRYDFAALETMSRGMQENARRIIRARNEELPMGKRMSNLEGPFRVWVVLKKLMKREGRQPDDMNATGGYGQGGVLSLIHISEPTRPY